MAINVAVPSDAVKVIDVEISSNSSGGTIVAAPSSANTVQKVKLSAENPRIRTAIKNDSRVTTASRVETLANVDISGGLADGYTIVYDDDTGQWIAQELATSVMQLDGGTY
jgi:hypothetical protein